MRLNYPYLFSMIYKVFRVEPKDVETPGVELRRATLQAWADLHSGTSGEWFHIKAKEKLLLAVSLTPSLGLPPFTRPTSHQLLA